MVEAKNVKEEREAKQRAWLRIGLTVLAVAAIGAIALSIDFEPSLSHIDIGIASGGERGHYYAQVEALAHQAERDHGVVRNLSTAGSGENLRRLADPGEGCEVDFGLVQDGSAFDDNTELEVVARLPHGETLFFLGRDAEDISDFRDLSGLTIAAGPEESGTAQLVDALFALPGFASLDVTLRHMPIADAIDSAAEREIDLAAMVVFEDSSVIRRAVRGRHLRVASFASAGAVATQLFGVSAAVIEAGHYDAVHGLPSSDRRVLNVDTLVIASRCAQRSEINAILGVLARELPGFVEHNRRTVPPHGIAMSNVASEYFDNHGPPIVDEYLPQIVDVVPLSNFMTFVMGISVLFNIMSLLNRFRVWRLDTRRVKIEQELRELFGGGITRGEIDLLEPKETLTTAGERGTLDSLIRTLRTLVEVCRKQAVSMLVPMGQEMVYRYQEDLMLDTLSVLHRLRKRLPELE